MNMDNPRICIQIKQLHLYIDKTNIIYTKTKPVTNTCIDGQSNAQTHIYAVITISKIIACMFKMLHL